MDECLLKPFCPIHYGYCSFTFTVAQLQFIYMFSSSHTLKDDVHLMQTLSLVTKQMFCHKVITKIS